RPKLAIRRQRLRWTQSAREGRLRRLSGLALAIIRLSPGSLRKRPSRADWVHRRRCRRIACLGLVAADRMRQASPRDCGGLAKEALEAIRQANPIRCCSAESAPILWRYLLSADESFFWRSKPLFAFCPPTVILTS